MARPLLCDAVGDAGVEGELRAAGGRRGACGNGGVNVSGTQPGASAGPTGVVVLAYTANGAELQAGGGGNRLRFLLGVGKELRKQGLVHGFHCGGTGTQSGGVLEDPKRVRRLSADLLHGIGGVLEPGRGDAEGELVEDKRLDGVRTGGVIVSLAQRRAGKSEVREAGIEQNLGGLLLCGAQTGAGGDGEIGLVGGKSHGSGYGGCDAVGKLGEGGAGS